MIAPINSRDVLLQQTVPRVVNLANNFITLVSPTLEAKYGSTNTPVPAVLEITAVMTGTITGTVTFQVTGLLANTVLVLDSANPNKLLLNPETFESDSVTVRATLNFKGVVYTSVSVTAFKVYASIAARLSRSFDNIRTDEDGTDYTLPAANLLELYNGTTKFTSGVVFGPTSTTKNGLTLQVNSSTGQITLSQASSNAWVSDEESFTLTAVRGTITYTTTYTITKILARPGDSAPLIQLSTPNKEFLYKDQFATSSLTPSTTITARLVNLTGIPDFTVEAFTRENVALGSIAFTRGTGTDTNKITITSAEFDARGITIGTAVVTATLGTISDVLTLYRINDGSEQITVDLTNESHQIPSYQDGTTTAASYEGSGTTIQVKEGNTYLTVDTTDPFANGTWRISNIDDVNIVCDDTPLLSTFQGLNYIEFDTHKQMADDKDVAYIDYTITGKTSTGKAFSIVKRQSFAKVPEGVAGATARAVNLTATQQAFITAKNSTVAEPSTITLIATQSNFVSPTYTWLVDNAVPSVNIGVATGNSFELKKFNPLGVKVVKVTVSEGTFSVFDTFSVYSFREGDDAFIVGLKNENQNISCDSAGNVLSGQFPFSTQMYAVLGGRFLTSTTTPVATFAPVSYNGGTNTTYRISADGVITIDSLDEEFGEAVFSATVNGVTLTKTLNLNKTFAGADASIVNVTASTQAFIAAKNTEVISPSTVTLTATAFNVGAAPNYAWSTSTNGGTSFTAVQTGTSSVYSLASFASGTTIVKVIVTGGITTVFDQITIYSLKEGSDSISVGLTNENQTISCNSDGTPIASPLNLNSELVVFRGTTRLTTTDGVVWSKVSETGMTSTIVTTTGAISISAISATTASATYRATITINSVATNFDKILTLNKSNNGLTGEGTTQIYIRSASQPTTPAASTVPPGPTPQWYATVDAATGTDPLWTSFGTRAVGATLYTWQAAVRVEGTTVINSPLKNATGYLYFGTASANAPTAPGPVAPATEMGYSFSTGEFTSLTAGWSTTISVAPADATLKMWAVRYSVQETVAGGAQTVTISSVFTHQNFNGLVTFTNNTYITPATVDSKITTAASTATFANSVTAAATIIDGAKITTGSILAEKLQIGKDRSAGSASPATDGNFIRMFDNKIIVYQNNVARVIIGDLS